MVNMIKTAAAQENSVLVGNEGWWGVSPSSCCLSMICTTFTASASASVQLSCSSPSGRSHLTQIDISWFYLGAARFEAATGTRRGLIRGSRASCWILFLLGPHWTRQFTICKPVKGCWLCKQDK